ncbi:helix-turn-helix domain-containing protein [Streptomyces rubiginosohelvolus]|uniref:helix-turn-helix domain-containing protein n=1 Tax=Streptomyces rubiginosohelvolus TaxID=67362 RepID=UPI0036F65D32
MSDASPPPAASDLPEVDITMNQVVAYNIAYFRKARGLTQEELGKRLEAITGKAWSKATMSAVERSWGGPRIRSFDADELTAFSQALGYPVNALLLPPEEDGGSVQYRFNNVGEGGWARHPRPYGTGEGLMGQLFISEYGDYLDEVYVERLQTAFDFYFGGIPEEAFFHNSRPDFVDEHVLADDQVDRLKKQVSTLREVIGMLDRAAKKLETGEVAVKAPRETQLQEAVRIVDGADPDIVRGARARELNSDFRASPGATYGFFSPDRDLTPEQRREQIQNALHVTEIFLLALRVWPQVGSAGAVDVLQTSVPQIERQAAKKLGVDGRVVQLISRALWGGHAEEALHAEGVRLGTKHGYTPAAALEEAQRTIHEQIAAEWEREKEAVGDVQAELASLPSDLDDIERWLRNVWRTEISRR